MTVLFANSVLLSPGEIAREIGRKARLLRKQKRLSRIRLSQMSGVSVSTIERFERGSMGISLANIICIAQALDATDELLELFKTPKFKTMKEFRKHASEHG